MRIGEDLHFDVAGVGHELFREQGGVAECGVRFTTGGGCGFREFFRAADEPHSFPAAARGGFEEQRVADLRGRSR